MKSKKFVFFLNEFFLEMKIKKNQKLKIENFSDKRVFV